MTRKRSPSYPGINLETALQRAQQLYAREKENWINVDVTATIWEYSSIKNSQVLISVAALKKFGLIEDNEKEIGGRRQIRLSELALRILRDPRTESPERQERIKIAALTPDIHKELWEEYKGNLPSDENLMFTLRDEYKFSDSGSEEFIKEFKSTITYSGLDKDLGTSYISEDNDSDKVGKDQFGFEAFGVNTVFKNQGSQSPPLQQQIQPKKEARNIVQIDTNMATFLLPTGDYNVSLITKSRMTQSAWDQMMAVLNAMKPAIVKEEPKPPEASNQKIEQS